MKLFTEVSRVASAIRVVSFVVLASCMATPAAAAITWSQAKPLNSDYAEYSGTLEIQPRVGSDGAGNVVAAWSTNNGVFAASSTDGGQTWGAEAQIASSTGPANFRVQNVVYAGSAWLVYYRTPSTSGFDITSESSFVSRSTDRLTWSAPERIDFQFYLPQASGIVIQEMNGGDMDSDGDGTVLALVDENLLLRSTDAGVTWTSSTLGVEKGNYNGRRLQLEHAGADKWYIAMSNSVDPYGSDRQPYSRFLVSRDDGLTWSVTDTTANFEDVRGLAAVGNTAVVANWPNLNTTTDGGATWTGAAGGGIEVLQTLVADASGNFIAAFETQLRSTQDPAAGWGPVVDISLPGKTSSRPGIAPTGDGSFVMVRTIFLDDAPWPGPETDVFSEVSSDVGATWSEPVLVNASGADDKGQVSDRLVKLAAGDDGLVLATWRVAPPVAGQTGMRYARSADNGHTWSAPAELLPLRQEIVSDHLLCYAGAGRWLAAWTPGDEPYWWQYSISDDNGLTWSPRQIFFGDVAGGSGTGTLVKGQDYGVGDPPTFALARLGRDAVSWEEPVIIDHKPLVIQHTGGGNWFVLASENTVYTSADDGRTWVLAAAPVNVPPAAESRVAVDANGTAMALSRELLSGIYSLYSSKSTDNGLTWTPRVPVGTYTSSGMFSDGVEWGGITSPVPGVWVVTYASFLDGVWTMQSEDDGASWRIKSTPPDSPITEAQYRINPAITASGGNVVLGWDNYAFATQYTMPIDIYYSIGAYTPTAAADWQLFE